MMKKSPCVKSISTDPYTNFIDITFTESMKGIKNRISEDGIYKDSLISISILQNKETYFPRVTLLKYISLQNDNETVKGIRVYGTIQQSSGNVSVALNTSA